jgi:hypothetical protein
VSAVPAGEVIARDDVFGKSMPCAVAGNTADAVLVDDEVALPVQAFARARHGVGERQRLVGGHETRTGHEEGGDFHVGPAMFGQIVHRVPDLARCERVAADLVIDRGKAARRRRGFDADLLARGKAEPAEGRHGEPGFAHIDERRVVGDHHRSENGAVACGHFDLARAGEAFGTQRLAPACEHDDVFAECIEGERLDGELHDAAASS